MISKKLNILISSLWGKYNNEIANIPKIDNIYLSTNKKTWCKFSTDDFYEQKYIMYINTDIEDQRDELIEQIMFHEFTHIYDSLNFIKYDKETFKKLMNIYSETHASEVMMDRLILTQNSTPYSLNSFVICNVRLSLKSYMEQTYKSLKDEFTFNRNSVLNKYNYKNFYYFLGYVISLRKNNIIYEYNFNEFDKRLSDLFYMISNSFLSNDYDIELLVEYENSLKLLVLYIIKENMGSFDK